MHCNGGSFHNIMPNIIPTSNTIHTSHAAMADQGLHLGREATAVRSSVQIYYGETLQSNSDLKTSACCTAKALPAEVLQVLRQVPQEITSRYYGCGSPFPVGLSGSGLRVLDLGCGTGRDCYVCAALVSEHGSVTGLDMTDAQLEVARQHSSAWQQHLGYGKPNMTFVKGTIEQLDAAGVAPGSVDIIISNCVVNLSPDKPAVLRQAHRALADGGEMYFSDVYCSRRLPAEVRTHDVLLGECLGGALHVNDFLRLCHEVGFADPRVLEAAPIEVHDAALRQLLGADAAFFSVTFRLFKLPPGRLEPGPAEDYGQSVTYRGDLPGAAQSYVLDSQHSFPAGVPVRVSGNTAAICGRSWLRQHFDVSAAAASAHLGQFGCCGDKRAAVGGAAVVDAAYVASLAAAPPASNGAAAGGCCPPKPQPATGCCAPKQEQQAAPACGAPKEAAPAKAGGCCGPKQEPAAAAAASGRTCDKPNSSGSGRACGSHPCC